MLGADRIALGPATPTDGIAIFIKRTADGTIAIKITRGVDIEDPVLIDAREATVGTLIRALQGMGIPGFGPLSLPSLAQLSRERGIGLLAKRDADGRIAYKLQDGVEIDEPTIVVSGNASINELLRGLKL